MSTVLVVDDDAHIRDVVQYALEREGFRVLLAADGREALAAVERGGVDLVVLDVLMPELDGLSVCRRLRARSELPIIFLSSRTEEVDRIVGLELGGDDYVSKPFSPRELATRVKTVLRRAQAAADHGTAAAAVDASAAGAEQPDRAAGAHDASATMAGASRPPPAAAGASKQPELLRHQRLEMDRGRHEVRVDRRHLVDLTVTEFNLLATLLERPGQVWTRAQLIDRARGEDTFITERTIDTHIRRVRAKLRPFDLDPIETVFGLGYRARDHRP